MPTGAVGGQGIYPAFPDAGREVTPSQSPHPTVPVVGVDGTRAEAVVCDVDDCPHKYEILALYRTHI
jgi:hypothetical protein